VFQDHLPVISQLPARPQPSQHSSIRSFALSFGCLFWNLTLPSRRNGDGPHTLSTTICAKRRANGLFCAAWRARARRMRSWKRSVVLMNCVSACSEAVRREICAAA
jgi:hypothetical protein